MIPLDSSSRLYMLLEEALYLRKLLGDGELPLEEVLGCVDDRLPLSLEIRARALIDGFPNLKDRAAAVFASTQTIFPPAFIGRRDN